MTRSAKASRARSCKLQRERGTDLTIFSPRAGGMGHHIGNAATSELWSGICNELIHRVCTLYPENFVGVCQLPQSPGVTPDQLHRRTRALRQGIRLHRLQSESGSVRRLLDRSAADRQMVVSALRKDGRARRAGDGPCQRAPATRISISPVRTISTATPPPSCSSSDLGSVQGFSDA